MPPVVRALARNQVRLAHGRYIQASQRWPQSANRSADTNAVNPLYTSPLCSALPTYYRPMADDENHNCNHSPNDDLDFPCLLASKWPGQTLDVDSVQVAELLDGHDELSRYRDEFWLPRLQDLAELVGLELQPARGLDDSTGRVDLDRPTVYLCGHSLGLQPRAATCLVDSAMRQWASLGVLVHRSGSYPASKCDLTLAQDTARLVVGAKADEVGIANSLTVNLHCLLAAFYRPQGEKSCILLEEGAFPSDVYAVESQVAWHWAAGQTTGHLKNALTSGNMATRMRFVKTPAGHTHPTSDDVIEAIRENADQLALILLPGVQYVTGQAFDIARLTKAGHDLAKCPVGWDLAHAVGNIQLALHKWDVDFAVWCTYKYLNSGPGGIGGYFVHRRHHHEPESSGPNRVSKRRRWSQQIFLPIFRRRGQVFLPLLNANVTVLSSLITHWSEHKTDGFSFMTNPLRGPQLTGWWGHRDETRFAMTGTMQLATGAAGYRISNPPLLLAASLRGQLDLLAGVPGGMEALRAKSVLLTGYLIHLITCSRWSLPPNCLQVVTPRRAADRGAQVTLRFVNRSLMPTCFMRLKRRGFICDYRVPDNIRVSPAPLYNTFRDVYHFAVNLYDILSDLTATT